MCLVLYMPLVCLYGFYMSFVGLPKSGGSIAWEKEFFIQSATTVHYGIFMPSLPLPLLGLVALVCTQYCLWCLVTEYRGERDKRKRQEGLYAMPCNVWHYSLKDAGFQEAQWYPTFQCLYVGYVGLYCVVYYFLLCCNDVWHLCYVLFRRSIDIWSS
jgi:hypothetical protein